MSLRVCLAGAKGTVIPIQLRRKDSGMWEDIDFPPTVSYLTSLQRSGQEVVYSIWTPPISGLISFGKYRIFPPISTLMVLVFQSLQQYKSLCLQSSKMHTVPFESLTQSDEISLVLSKHLCDYNRHMLFCKTEKSSRMCCMVLEIITN